MAHELKVTLFPYFLEMRPNIKTPFYLRSGFFYSYCTSFVKKKDWHFDWIFPHIYHFVVRIRDFTVQSYSFPMHWSETLKNCVRRIFSLPKDICYYFCRKQILNVAQPTSQNECRKKGWAWLLIFPVWVMCVFLFYHFESFPFYTANHCSSFGLFAIDKNLHMLVILEKTSLKNQQKRFIMTPFSETAHTTNWNFSSL